MGLWAGLLTTGAATAVTLQPARAWAADSDAATRARVLMRAGILYFNEGDMPAAVAQMKAAYRIHPVPQIQFNLALCYERQGDFAGAVSAYESYLQGSPDAGDRAEVQAKIAALRQRLAEPSPAGTLPAEPGGTAVEEPAPSQAAPAATAAPVGAAAATPGAQGVVFKTLVVYKEAPPAAGRNARRAAVATLVLGGVSAAAAVAFGVVGANTLSDLEAEVQRFSSSMPPPPDQPSIPSPCVNGQVNEAFIQAAQRGNMNLDVNPLRNSTLSLCTLQNIGRAAANANFTAAAVSGAISVAALGGSLALYLIGRRQDRRQAQELREAARRPEVALAPLWLSGGGGVVLGGRF